MDEYGTVLVGGLALLLFLSVGGWIWTIINGNKGKPSPSFEEDGRWYYVYLTLNDRRFPDQIFFLIQGAGSEPRCVVVERSLITGTLVRGDCWVRTYQPGKKKPRVVEVATGEGHAPPVLKLEESKGARQVSVERTASKG